MCIKNWFKFIFYLTSLNVKQIKFIITVLSLYLCEKMDSVNTEMLSAQFSCSPHSVLSWVSDAFLSPYRYDPLGHRQDQLFVFPSWILFCTVSLNLSSAFLKTLYLSLCSLSSFDFSRTSVCPSVEVGSKEGWLPLIPAECVLYSVCPLPLGIMLPTWKTSREGHHRILKES